MTHTKITDAIASTDKETQLWKSRFSLAKAAYAEADFKQCRTLLAKALEQGHNLKEREFAVNTCLVGLGATDLAEGKPDEARKHLDKAVHALSGATEPALKELYGVALRFSASAHVDKGDAESARETLLTAIDVLEGLGTDGAVQLAYALSDLSVLYITQGELTECRDLIVSAIELLETTLGPENAEYLRANVIFNVSQAKDEKELLSGVEDSIVKLRYQKGHKHPSISKAIKWYLKKLHEHGDKELIAEAEQKFGTVTS